MRDICICKNIKGNTECKSDIHKVNSKDNQTEFERQQDDWFENNCQGEIENC